MEVEAAGPKNCQDSSSAWGQSQSTCGGSTWMLEREDYLVLATQPVPGDTLGLGRAS